MARKDIPDLLVCQVTEEMDPDRGVPGRKHLIQRLMEKTGQCEKVCYAAAARTADRGLIEYGVAVRWPWLTRKGRWMLAHEKMEQGKARAREMAAMRFAANEALLRRVAADTQAALRDALNAIPAAAGLNAFGVAERVRHVIIGESEAYYFDETPIILVHPLVVVDGTATRNVERLVR